MKKIFKLCFVDNGNAYFTDVDIKDIWGDDWNDAPYEHNCGYPYASVGQEFKTIRFFPTGVGYSIDEPKDSLEFYRTYIDNSPFSVEDINNKKTPWLRIYEDDLSEKILERIYAGATIEKVIDIFNKFNVDYIVKDFGIYLE